MMPTKKDNVDNSVRKLMPTLTLGVSTRRENTLTSRITTRSASQPRAPQCHMGVGMDRQPCRPTSQGELLSTLVGNLFPLMDYVHENHS